MSIQRKFMIMHQIMIDSITATLKGVFYFFCSYSAALQLFLFLTVLSLLQHFWLPLCISTHPCRSTSSHISAHCRLVLPFISSFYYIFLFHILHCLYSFFTHSLLCVCLLPTLICHWPSPTLRFRMPPTDYAPPSNADAKLEILIRGIDSWVLVCIEYWLLFFSFVCSCS